MTGYCTACGVATSGTDEEHLREFHLFGPTSGKRVVDQPPKRGFQYRVGVPARRRPVSVDQACVDLAEHFLSGVRGARKEDVQELAEEIQRRCEDACNEVESTERAR